MTAVHNAGSPTTRKERAEPEGAPLAFTIARVLLVLTLMAAPLAFGAVQIWAWASLAVIAAVLLILWAVGCVQQSTVNVHWSGLHVPAALFLLLGIGQLIGHRTLDPFGTREALIKLMTDLILFFLAGQLWVEASEKAWKRFGVVVAVYAFSMSLFAIIQFFTSHGLLYWVIRIPTYVFGPYVNRNHYAGLMEMLIPIALCYALSRLPKSQERTFLLFGVCAAIASVLVSGSRGGSISVVVEIVILAVLLWQWKSARIGRKWESIGLLGAAGAAALFLAITPMSAWQRLATVTGLARKPEVTLEDRLVVSRDALAALKDYPWLGTGLGSFESVFPQYQSFPTDLVWDYAHDDYVEALTETGAVGGLLMLSALFLFGRLAFRNLPEHLKDARGWIQLGATLGVCGLLIHSLVDFNLHIPANAAWFGVCAGLATVGKKFFPYANHKC